MILPPLRSPFLPVLRSPFDVASAIRGATTLTERVRAALYSNGEQGGMWDATDMATLFQDSAGATPVTALTQPIGRMLDISGNGNHLLQATAGARPQYTTDGALFDGVDDALATLPIDFTGMSEMTLAAAFTRLSGIHAAALFGAGVTTWTSNGNASIWTPEFGGSDEFVVQVKGNANNVRDYGPLLDDVPTRVVATVRTTAANSVAAISMVINGNPVSGVSLSTNNSSGNFGEQPIKCSHETYSLHGYIRRTFALDRPLTPDELLLVDAWLAEVQ